jgi:hypothetical protein
MPPRDPHHRDVDQIVFELHAATLQANLERQLLGRADAYDRARRVIARLTRGARWTMLAPHALPARRTAARAAPRRARAAVTRDPVGDGAACDDR